MTPAVEPCLARAELIVLRGRTARLWLCRAHRGCYAGSGRVMDYLGYAEWTPESRGTPGGPLLGPVRRCGEEMR